jgi:hypothetical protein
VARIPDLLTSATTRAATLEVLVRPELTETVRTLLESPSVQTALVALVGSDKTQRQVARLFDNPQLAQPLLPVLASVRNSPQQTALLENTHVQNFLAKTLTQEPALRVQTLEILSQARTPAPAEQLLNRPEVRVLLPELLEAPATRPALLQIFSRLNQQSPSSPATQNLLSVLQEPRMTEILKSALLASTQSPSLSPAVGRPVPAEQPVRPAVSPPSASPSSLPAPEQAEIALRLLARISNAPSSSSANPVVPDRNLTVMLQHALQNPSLRPAVFDILAHSPNEPLAREVLSNPETQQTLARCWDSIRRERRPPTKPRPNFPQMNFNSGSTAQPPGNRPANLELLGNDSVRLAQLVQDLANRVSPRAALDLLTRPDLQNLWNAAEKNPDIQKTIESLLLAPGSQTSLRALLRQPERAVPLLERLAQPANIEWAARLFEQPHIQATASSLIAQPETRAPFLRLLAQPAWAEVSARILSQPNVQDDLVAILHEPSARALLRPLLERPTGAETLARLLQNATQNGAPDETRLFLQTILQTLRVATHAGTNSFSTPNGLLNLSLNQALARYGASISTSAPQLQPFEISGGGTPVAPETRNTSSSSPKDSTVTRLDATLRQTFGLNLPSTPSSLAEPVLQMLEAALTRLGVVSPARAQNALRTLLLLGLTESPELNRVVEQIARRMEGIAAQLAQKGGLPIGQIEPTLADTPLLPLRFGALSSEQMGTLVRTLSQNGLEVRFVGRDASGQVQLHLLLGDLPAGVPVRQANLSSADLAALRPALGENRALDPAQPAIWTRTGGILPAETPSRIRPVPNVLLAANRPARWRPGAEALATRAGNPANPFVRRSPVPSPHPFSRRSCRPYFSLVPAGK